MAILIFLAAWAVRSAVVALTAAVLLALFRVKDASVRLAAWTAALFGSLLIPALTMTLPAVSLPDVPGFQPPAAARSLASRNFAIPPRTAQLPEIAASPGASGARQPARWPALLLALYCVGAAALLLRLVTGLVLSRRLIRKSRPTCRCLPGGLPIHESSELTVPAAIGPLRPLVVLPRDWREWDASKLEAILAHEQSHIRRHDPAVQLLSAIHRALLWYSPLSWWMHNRIVRLAEEASDDAALAATKDRVSYAETLLQFMQRGTKVAHWEGVAMARYGRADDRIHRILDGTAISRGLTRLALATILLLGTAVVFLAAAAVPAPPQAPVAPQAPDAPSAPAPPEAPPSAPPADRRSSRVTRYLIVSGDSSSGSWDSRDEPRFKQWRARYGAHYAWFRQDGRDYVISDEHTLAEIQDAMAPQLDVNRRQEEVNRHQAEVNRMQGGVNSHQADVNRAQAEVNRQQSLVNEETGGQSRVNQLQSEVNGKQQTVNAEQDRVNQEQDVVNHEQDKVNQMQTRASAVIEKALQAIFDSARRQGLAHEVH
jgi:beta-lactamase regulating signal transducer with metallopeptidase domain